MAVSLVITLFVGALVASALGSALGMAGGIFIVPLLTLGADIPFPTAVAVSLIAVIASSCSSAPRFLSAGLTNLRLAVVLEVATTFGALVGVAMVGLVADEVLYGIFTGVLLVSAAQMLHGRKPREPLPVPAHAFSHQLDSSFIDLDGENVDYQVSRLPMGVSFMFLAGVLSALLGIGSGVLKIPAMDAAMRLPIKASSATANLMIGVTASGAAAAYLLGGNIDLILAAPIVLGSLSGAVLGARILVRMAGSGLRIIFTVVLLSLAVPMAANALGLGWTMGS